MFSVIGSLFIFLLLRTYTNGETRVKTPLRWSVTWIASVCPFVQAREGKGYGGTCGPKKKKKKNLKG